MLGVSLLHCTCQTSQLAIGNCTSSYSNNNHGCDPNYYLGLIADILKNSKKVSKIIAGEPHFLAMPIFAPLYIVPFIRLEMEIVF